MGAGAILRGLTQAGTRARLGHVQGQQDAEAALAAKQAQEAEREKALQAQLRQDALLKFQLEAPQRQRGSFDYEQGVRTRDRMDEIGATNDARIQQIIEQGKQSRQNASARPVRPSASVRPPRPPTEVQAKARFFHKRASHATKTLSQFDNAKMLDVVASKANLFGNWAKSAEGRQLYTAGKMWAQAVLRQDSGGAITEAEMDEYFETYLPRPGDDDATLEQKRAARQVVEEGLAELGQVQVNEPVSPWGPRP